MPERASQLYSLSVCSGYWIDVRAGQGLQAGFAPMRSFLASARFRVFFQYSFSSSLGWSLCRALSLASLALLSERLSDGILPPTLPSPSAVGQGRCFRKTLVVQSQLCKPCHHWTTDDLECSLVAQLCCHPPLRASVLGSFYGSAPTAIDVCLHSCWALSQPDSIVSEYIIIAVLSSDIFQNWNTTKTDLKVNYRKRYFFPIQLLVFKWFSIMTLLEKPRPGSGLNHFFRFFPARPNSQRIMHAKSSIAGNT